jgi:hypothetical protein
MPISKLLSLLGCCLLLSATGALAQDTDKDKDKEDKDEEVTVTINDHFWNPPVRHWYTGNAFDGAMFQTAIVERPNHDRQTATLRFSLIAIGNNFHYDFDKKFGLFTGIGIKNVGWIEKNDDSTTKRRLYSLGIPLALKLGDLQKRHYGFLGGGIDIPINYREKRFINRGDKYKFNEFWSDRTDPVMPYLFAGASFGMGAVFKVQYYPGNFFNTGFTENKNGATVTPYQGYMVHMLYFSLGFDIRYKPHHKGCCDDTAAPSEI